MPHKIQIDDEVRNATASEAAIVDAAHAEAEAVAAFYRVTLPCVAYSADLGQWVTTSTIEETA